MMEKVEVVESGGANPNRDATRQAWLEAGGEPETERQAGLDTLVVPRRWGSGEPDESLELRYILTPPESEDRQEIESRVKVDKEIRATLEGKGIRVEETRRKETDGSNEVILRGRIDKDLPSEITEIAPEISQIGKEPVKEYLRVPHFPVVLYTDGQSGGMGKYLLENQDQVERLEQFFREVKRAAWLEEKMSCKDFVNTPSDRFTSFRIVVTSTGDIIAGGLLYSGQKEDQGGLISSDIDPGYLGVGGSSIFDYLGASKSPYFLGSRKFTSNVHGGGGCIPLNPNERSRQINAEEDAILVAHGVENQEIPERLASAAREIAKYLGPQKGLFFGIDFIQDKEGNYYFLEANTGPGVQTVNEVENGGKQDPEEGYRILMHKAIESVYSIVA